MGYKIYGQPSVDSLGKNEANIIENSAERRRETEKKKERPLFEQLDPALPGVTLDFQLHEPIHFPLCLSDSELECIICN